ncbi:O-antigen translocase [Undibacterium sp. SXout20W]|uniref:O-antigen translocase n=1 Tax=Undibacterium sp. SXout20W TaxID=3413051 RepID=UPI003BEFF2D0
MSLVKTSLLNGVAVAVKVGSAVLLNKILAVYVGPAGYAAIGQFQNVLAIISNLAGGIVAPGVTKGTAENFDDTVRQHWIWQTAFQLTLIVTAFIATVLLVGGDWLSVHLLQRQELGNGFIWAIIALPGIAANNILLAIINGKKEVGIYVASNILGSIISLCSIGFLTYLWGLKGALIALAISPAVLLIGTAAIVVRRPWFRLQYLFGKIQKPVLNELMGFGLMGLTSALAAPFTYIFVRDFLSVSLSPENAGYWQASWKISEIYLMLVTTTLSIYYLPRLAEIVSAKELKTEILKVYKFALPVVICGACTMYFLRDFIIDSLFSNAFRPMRDLFFWQLSGDVIKIGSWILSYVMLGRAMVKAFVITECVFALSFYLLTRILVAQYGLVGVSIAYAVNYCFYWCAMFFLVRNLARNFQVSASRV